MPDSDFAAELARYGPRAPEGKPPTLREARRYCRRLARADSGNSTALSRFLPGDLRQHFCNIASYRRWADDLTSQAGSPQEALALLAWWDTQVRRCYQGQAAHPVLVALADTIHQYAIPPDPLVDLLVAMRQDQCVNRYETIDHLLQYCRYSANPLGRLLLHIGRCHDEASSRLADSACTGLQLAGFCQNVARDWKRGRLYLPLADCRRFGVDEATLSTGRCMATLRQLLAVEVQQAEGWLRAGWPLVARVPRSLQLTVALSIRHGLAILAAIRRQDFDVWSRRPALPSREQWTLWVHTWWQQKRGRLENPVS